MKKTIPYILAFWYTIKSIFFVVLYATGLLSIPPTTGENIGYINGMFLIPSLIVILVLSSFDWKNLEESGYQVGKWKWWFFSPVFYLYFRASRTDKNYLYFSISLAQILVEAFSIPLFISDISVTAKATTYVLLILVATGIVYFINSRKKAETNKQDEIVPVKNNFSRTAARSPVKHTAASIRSDSIANNGNIRKWKIATYVLGVIILSLIALLLVQCYQYRELAKNKERISKARIEAEIKLLQAEKKIDMYEEIIEKQQDSLKRSDNLINECIKLKTSPPPTPSYESF